MKEFIDKIEGVEEGTDINRANLMAVQGFQDNDIVITENGNTTTVIETNGNGEVYTSEITENADGSYDIVETVVGDKTITKTTTINADCDEISGVLS